MNNFNCSGNIGTYTCIHLKGNNKLINALAICDKVFLDEQIMYNFFSNNNPSHTVIIFS